MRRLTAGFLAGLFALAVAMPGIAVADCPGHEAVTASTTVTTTDSTKTTSIPTPETKTGG